MSSSRRAASRTRPNSCQSSLKDSLKMKKGHDEPQHGFFRACAPLWQAQQSLVPGLDYAVFSLPGALHRLRARASEEAERRPGRPHVRRLAHPRVRAVRPCQRRERCVRSRRDRGEDLQPRTAWLSSMSSKTPTRCSTESSARSMGSRRWSTSATPSKRSTRFAGPTCSRTSAR